ncbi:hypothetical protein Dda_2245 [Drechslerella dactyloides]|uniref:2-isopropylmalate synthase n=1 Tax=Drechslerella dactyloides TaxID=74499 RepID=A0AAD6J423_DREDA|nr:hypothetical protein Dda_2245 [Drechslerella dactyloides]
MPMLKDPSRKYRPFKPLDLPNRQWPSKTITRPPRWLATDLRDGNQSLVDPMDGDQKLRFFKLLIELGYKEIEVSFPSASQTDFDFTRRLIEEPGTVPPDVHLQVLSPCREDFIKRTVESLYGAKNGILHLYLATSECFRRIIFNMSEEESLALAVKCTAYARSITKDSPDPAVRATHWQYEFSPETFSDTSPEYVIRVCNAVKDAWGPTVDNPIIFNLPATVEVATPNVYADQIEYFCTHISEREKVCVSLHPHNDRGCAIAAAELAQMAGADRVEGCLFGNGERTGNVDLVTLALNLYTQGISPGIDFSDITRVIEIVEDSNKIPVHPRQPYGGQLVVCAFSGSHQDAIKKGFKARTDSRAEYDDRWDIPYLPLDPQDIGRTYEAVIRVNSQSGKGGAAWIILQHMQLDLPRGLQIAFAKVVQRHTELCNRELKPHEIVKLFEEAYYIKSNPRFTLVDYDITTDRAASRGRAPLPPPPPIKTTTNMNGHYLKPVEEPTKRHFEGIVALDGIERSIRGVGNGAISSMANALQALGVHLEVKDYKEHALSAGTNVKAVAYIECLPSENRLQNGKMTNGSAKEKTETVWGVGVHEDVVQASLIALLGAASSFLSSKPSTPTTEHPVEVTANGHAHPITALNL